ncbi:MAG: 50S ribosomal protein L3 [Alphaproteobacteria bacterium]|jgi:large subunit ribosomal protein L3|nr:50S ribosomal protein L3 [Alphaproteobacteria bacterium]
MRTGLILKKLGMTRKFNESGEHVPVTVLQLENIYVTSILSQEKNGYDAVQLATKKAKVKNTTQQMRGHFAKAKVEPQQILREFRLPEAPADVQVGDQLDVSHFVAGQFVDVIGQSKGKGFQGVIKRYGFAIRGRSNVSLNHRGLGAVAGCQDPGRVFKNAKMAGHMGDERVTIQNLRVVSVDQENQLIFVKGAVPGTKNGYVMLCDAVKKTMPSDLPKFGLKRSKQDTVQSAVVSMDATVEEVASNPESQND